MVNSPRDGSLGEPALFCASSGENKPLAPAAPSAAAPRMKLRLQISHIEPLPVSAGFLADRRARDFSAGGHLISAGSPLAVPLNPPGQEGLIASAQTIARQADFMRA